LICGHPREKAEPPVDLFTIEQVKAAQTVRIALLPFDNTLNIKKIALCVC